MYMYMYVSGSMCYTLADINECEADERPCKDGEHCINNEGSYTCKSKYSLQCCYAAFCLVCHHLQGQNMWMLYVYKFTNF